MENLLPVILTMLLTHDMWQHLPGIFKLASKPLIISLLLETYRDSLIRKKKIKRLQIPIGLGGPS